MNKNSFAHRAKVLLAGLGLALLFGLSTTSAHAQNNKKANDPAALGMAAAPELVALAKIDCQVTAAAFLADTNLNIDNKPTKAKTYELACAGGPGWIITKVENGGVESPYNCTQGATYALTVIDFIQCTLPANQPHYTWMDKDIKPYAPDCTLIGARLIGSSSQEPRYDRYEYACQGSAGGVIDLAAPGSTAEVAHRNCVMTAGTPAACQYTTPEQARNALLPEIQKASATCQVDNMRYVGIRSTNDGYFYEVGCANEPGFVMITNLQDDYDSVVACNAAAGLGGCQFTTVEEASGEQMAHYGAALKAQKITCTIEEFNIIGTQANTKRDYVELKCAEQPFGLIGFLPQEGSDAEANVADCFIDQTRRKSCTFVTEEQLTAHWDKLIKVARPTAACDVSEVRYIGESEGVENGVIAELACSNKRGYIAVLDTNRQSLVETIPCTIAKSRGEDQQCQIAGNGTYSSNEQ